MQANSCPCQFESKPHYPSYMIRKEMRLILEDIAGKNCQLQGELQDHGVECKIRTNVPSVCRLMLLILLRQ